MLSRRFHSNAQGLFLQDDLSRIVIIVNVDQLRMNKYRLGKDLYLVFAEAVKEYYTDMENKDEY